VCDEIADNPEYDDSHYSECPIGNLHARYRCCPAKVEGRIFGIMDDVLTLSPIQQSGFWRVEMAWPGHSPRYFGWFVSQLDAERWIEEHRWLTTPKS
jgi:hypothetical protein